MDFKKYCDAFFSLEKDSLHDVSDVEIDLLKSYDGSTKVDYFYLDSKISDYISENNINLFSDDSVSERGLTFEYVVGCIIRLENIDEHTFFEREETQVLEKINDFFHEYIFMRPALNFIEQKLCLYSSIYNSSIRNSTEYTDNKFSSVSEALNERIKTVEDTDEKLTDSTKKMNSARKELFAARKKIKNVESQLKSSIDTMENIMPNMLTVLSILISIIIAVVIVYITIFLEKGGSETAFKNILQVQMGRYVLSGHIVGDIMFVLMFMIARLTNRSILMTCSKYQIKDGIKSDDEDKYISDIHKFACANCRKECNFKQKLKRKAAYIVWFNIVMVVLYFILYFWWVIEHYWPLGWQEFHISQDIYVVFAVLAVLIMFAISILIKYIKKQRAKSKKQNYVNNFFGEFRKINNELYWTETSLSGEPEHVKRVELSEKNFNFSNDKTIKKYLHSKKVPKFIKYFWTDNRNESILHYAIFE